MRLLTWWGALYLLYLLLYPFCFEARNLMRSCVPIIVPIIPFLSWSSKPDEELYTHFTHYTIFVPEAPNLMRSCIPIVPIIAFFVMRLLTWWGAVYLFYLWYHFFYEAPNLMRSSIPIIPILPFSVFRLLTRWGAIYIPIILIVPFLIWRS